MLLVFHATANAEVIQAMFRETIPNTRGYVQILNWRSQIAQSLEWYHLCRRHLWSGGFAAGLRHSHLYTAHVGPPDTSMADSASPVHRAAWQEPELHSYRSFV